MRVSECVRVRVSVREWMCANECMGGDESNCECVSVSVRACVSEKVSVRMSVSVWLPLPTWPNAETNSFARARLAQHLRGGGVSE